jgi:hypothetical protein
MTWAISQQWIVNILKSKKLFSLCCQSIIIIDITKQKTLYSKEKIQDIFMGVNQAINVGTVKNKGEAYFLDRLIQLSNYQAHRENPYKT